MWKFVVCSGHKFSVNMNDYKNSLIDPFDPIILQPKLLDGRVSRSAGIRLRSTGEISCDVAGSTYIALIPGLSNAICWKTAPAVETTPPAFHGHVGTPSDREFVKQARIVSVALRLSLLNNTLENEGYWEAARIPVEDTDFTIDPVTGLLTLSALTTGFDLANHQTYQTGKIRDLFRYQFKLNSQNSQHPFGPISPVTDENYADSTFDVIIIKVKGRTTVGSASVLMYDVVSNQEIIYSENTALSRLMTKNDKMHRFEDIMLASHYPLPAMLNNV
jgi:hypothetical protein